MKVITEIFGLDDLWVSDACRTEGVAERTFGIRTFGWRSPPSTDTHSCGTNHYLYLPPSVKLLQDARKNHSLWHEFLSSTHVRVFPLTEGISVGQPFYLDDWWVNVIRGFDWRRGLLNGGMGNDTIPRLLQADEREVLYSLKSVERTLLLRPD